MKTTRWIRRQPHHPSSLGLLTVILCFVLSLDAAAYEPDTEFADVVNCRVPEDCAVF